MQKACKKDKEVISALTYEKKSLAENSLISENFKDSVKEIQAEDGIAEELLNAIRICRQKEQAKFRRISKFRFDKVGLQIYGKFYDTL